MYCGNCGAKNKDEQNFCCKCGAKLLKIKPETVRQPEVLREEASVKAKKPSASLETPPVRVWYCGECGAKNEDKYNFCRKCGAKLLKVATVPVPQPAATIEEPSAKILETVTEETPKGEVPKPEALKEEPPEEEIPVMTGELSVVPGTPPVKVWYCGECGTKNEDKYSFCRKCGAKLLKTAPEHARQPGSPKKEAPVKEEAAPAAAAAFASVRPRTASGADTGPGHAGASQTAPHDAGSAGAALSGQPQDNGPKISKKNANVESSQSSISNQASNHSQTSVSAGSKRNRPANDIRTNADRLMKHSKKISRNIAEKSLPAVHMTLDKMKALVLKGTAAISPFLASKLDENRVKNKAGDTVNAPSQADIPNGPVNTPERAKLLKKTYFFRTVAAASLFVSLLTVVTGFPAQPAGESEGTGDAVQTESESGGDKKNKDVLGEWDGRTYTNSYFGYSFTFPELMGDETYQVYERDDMMSVTWVADCESRGYSWEIAISACGAYEQYTNAEGVPVTLDEVNEDAVNLCSLGNFAKLTQDTVGGQTIPVISYYLFSGDLDNDYWWAKSYYLLKDNNEISFHIQNVTYTTDESIVTGKVTAVHLEEINEAEALLQSATISQ